jgi:choline kinase
MKVVIPSAGIGSRIGPYTKTMNKALVQTGLLPAIARIIMMFPKNVEFVIILGYCGSHVEQACLSIFPDRNFKFITVEKFDGDGSGLGYSLLAAEQELQCPFIFCPNDTIINTDNLILDPSVLGNWAAYYEVTETDDIPIEQYRTLSISNEKVVNFNPKGLDFTSAYTGMCGVKDFQIFWENMKKKDALVVGESYGLKHLPEINAIKITEWYDTGNLKSIQRAKEKFKLENVNILEKEDEAIWFCQNRVTKFHVDDKFITDRCQRLNFLHPDLFPSIIATSKNTYSYEHIEGIIFSKAINNNLVFQLLDEMQNKLWSVAPKDDLDNVKTSILSFYKTKTIERVEYYLNRFEKVDGQVTINGITCNPVLGYLKSKNWDRVVQKTIIGRFHGDFHSENILFTGTAFKLIDWRQNFGSLGLEFGDVYYDLGKFLHGLIVSHQKVSADQFGIQNINEHEMRINIDQNFINTEAIGALKLWCVNNRYDFEHVQFITALIYLNVAGLHEHPYSDFLFNLGKLLLTKWSTSHEA